jgi:predicted dehydrogenase
MERRHFLMASAAVAGSAKKAIGANDKVRVAVVGVRGQGNSHLQAYSKMPDVEIAAICDIDDAVIGKRLETLKSAGVPEPKVVKDLRKLLEDKDIDAISIATPNHLHTMQTIWGLQAGKHVYCEKPCSHNIFESKQIVAAAKKYGKVVQHGVNARSHAGPMEGVKQMREGLIGDVYMSRALIFKRRNTIGRKPVSPVPAGVDYDLWLGPAPKREFTENRFHYNWHWFWDYGNGDIGNQGIHEIDISRWGLGVTLPTKVSAIGGHFMFDDDQETPNTITATYEFNDGGKKRMMVVDVRHWDSNPEAGIKVGNLFYGSKGHLSINGYNDFKSYLGDKAEPGPAKNEGGSNWRNFIEVVKSGDLSKQSNPIEEGAYSCTLMHLANISYRVGRTIQFDPAKLEIVGDAEASRMMSRMYRAPFVVPNKV